MPVSALSSLAARFDAWLAPPSPALSVEIAPGRLAAGRRLGETSAPRLLLRPLPPGAVAASATRVNIPDPEAVAQQLRVLLASLRGTRGEAAPASKFDVAGHAEPALLLVPDLTARVSLLDFDHLPSRKDELVALARFRLRKSLPFAEDQAAISCQALSPTRMLVAVADRLRLDEYEGCLEAAGARAGIVLPSSLACLAAVPVLEDAALLIRAEPGSLTTAFCRQGRVEFFRVVELSQPATFDDVFPSVAFFRDAIERAQAGQPLLYAAGLEPALVAQLREEIGWAQVRTADSPAEMALAGALRGLFA